MNFILIKICLHLSNLFTISEKLYYTMQVTIFLYNTQSLVHAISSAVVFLPCHFVRLSRIFSRCLPLSFLPLIMPVFTIFSNFPFLKMCQMNLDYFFLTSMIVFLFSLTCFRMFSLVILSVHGTFSILSQNHICIASSRFSIPLFIVQTSLP
jgi:hypothetical protein